MSQTQQTPSPYIGRFAPSPTGKLHFGSLVAALASYLDAKAHQGQWLLRMEDLDPPRAEAGAADSIIKSLEAHHLLWDQAILYQSSRLDAYQEILEQLPHYRCSCTRQRIIELKGCYDQHCRLSAPAAEASTAIRLKVDQLAPEQQQQAEQFTDLFIGPQTFPLAANGDIIIKRKDGLFAYQLAVAADDRYQGITHVVRGRDLIDSTGRQRYLLLMLNNLHDDQLRALPEYGHTPLALGRDGDKLSKQTHAQALDDKSATDNLIAALRFLNHEPPLKDLDKLNCTTLLEWAIQAWDRNKVPRHSAVAPSLPDA